MGRLAGAEAVGSMQSQPARLPLIRKLGFGIGDFGLNLYWQAINLFLFYFYTDVFAISTRWAGIIFLLASVWDGAADPVFAIIADGRTSRWGTYRPYLLFGGLPLGLCFVAAFSYPGLAGGSLIAYALVTHIGLRTAYTVINIPYAALSARVVADPSDRTSMVGYRMQFAFLGALTVSFLLPVLVRALGAGDVASGYRAATAIIGGLSTVAFTLCFLGTREQAGLLAPEAARRISLRGLGADALAFLRLVSRSRPLVRVLIAVALFSAANTVFNKNILYLFKYQLHQIDLLPYVLPLTAIANLAAIPPWVAVIQRFGKRNGWIAGSAIMASGLAALYVSPSDNLPAALVLLAVVSIGSAAHAICIWSLLPDVVDDLGRRFGRRDEAKVFGLSSFLQKIAIGMSAMALGLLLQRIGFVANAGQSPGTLQGLHAIMCLPPIACLALSVVAIWPLSTSDERHAD